MSAEEIRASNSLTEPTAAEILSCQPIQWESWLTLRNYLVVVSKLPVQYKYKNNLKTTKRVTKMVYLNCNELTLNYVHWE